MKLLQPFDIDLAGINLVEASAGTGKTYNITSLYIRALIEQDITVGKILVVTYTEAATKELKDRLLSRIRESIEVLKLGKVDNKSDDFLEDLLDEIEHPQKAVAKLENAVRMFDEASVYTIHGFCYQALQEQAFESRAMYDAEMIGDDKELVQEAVDDYWRSWVAEVSANPQKQPLLKLLNDRGIHPNSLASELKNVIGKPYLKVLPENADIEGLESRLRRLKTLHNEMQTIWKDERSQLLDLLSRDEMSNYRSDWLSGWFAQMDEIFHLDTATINVFDKFERFIQSYIDDSLKKDAVKKGINPPQHKFFKLADEYWEITQSLQGFDIIFKKELLNFLRKELIQKKEEKQVLSYDDLLLRLRNALMDEKRGPRLASKLRQKYPISLVDEFQDTDPNQYDIFRTVYKDSDGVLFMIGDPKQSIYGFRGADVYSYIKARRDAPEENRYKLNRNFRSTPQLLRGLNAFWGRHDDPFAVGEDIQYKEVTWGKNEDDYLKLTEFGKERPPIRFRRLSELGQGLSGKGDARKRVADDTAKEINRLIEGGRHGDIVIGENNVHAKDIAVLVRTHKQANLMSNALQAYGIKSVRHSEQSVFESDEAAHLEQLLKAVAEPGNEMLIKTALSLPLTGYSAEQLFAIEEDNDIWPEMLQQFSEWHRIWNGQGFSAMYRSLLTKLNVQEQVITYSDGERRLTNLLHLGELLEEESRKHKEGTRSLLQWLARKRQDTTKNKSDEEQMRLESDEALVKIVTMHKSKGLQYPIVFCPFLWHGPKIENKDTPLEYHDPENPDITYLDLNSKRDPDRSEKRFYKEKEELAENLRLAYVAMTRAEYCLYISWEFARATQFSPFGYLLQDPEQAIALLKEKVGFGSNNDIDWSGDELHQTIENLCDEHPHLFTLKDGKEVDYQKATDKEHQTKEAEAKHFKRSLPLATSYQVSSFSSLSSWMDEDDPDVPDYDQFMNYSDMEEQTTKKSVEKTMFTFPKGPQPGTCIHNIFENYFSKSGEKDEVITNQLQLNGIDLEWKNTVSDMLDLVLQKSLHQDIKELSLSAVKDSQIPEMEFYYQNDEIETRELLSIIRNGAAPGWENKGRAESGFLKGFIDLTFEFNGKYYLLDYKTNYLGDAISDYGQDELQHEMRDASYDLQYHIYTVALHRFLKKRLSGYSYNKHFGGAFYLFLRGMNKESMEGIFFDRPEKKIITALDEYIKGGSDG
ncbi:exodeoxyribonuclease V subunit beta [Fodinibius sp.]|uniref:exodeoxyribonuclease V subunit beta n=1 Tax=Fodinibius sp. TaxID=1872440 RepID=UPI002ACE72A3|nr:exodeoxyribonuclease V subunit beta [Fodinibius sp.]MDZ7659107.1 exodeoxyribonuclease V subunit beta [Fodinibius sp.]